jgi:hypothetical protein
MWRREFLRILGDVLPPASAARQVDCTILAADEVIG